MCIRDREYEEGYEDYGYEEYEGGGEPFISPYDKPIAVKPVMLREITDIESVLSEIEENNILIVRYDEMARRGGRDELRVALKQLKEKVRELGGDVVLIKTEDYPPLLVVPRFVAVLRRPE